MSDSSKDAESSRAGRVCRVLHDLKQPLNQIRVIAQDIRIDAKKERLDVASVPDSMKEIENAVDDLVNSLDRIGTIFEADEAERG